MLTLISKDECELNTDGTILLCKYTKPNNTLRIVATALGTSQVVYYRFTTQGLEDNEGDVLLSPEFYATTVAELDRQQRKKEAEIEKERLERKHEAEMMANAELETRTIATFSLASSDYGRGKVDCSLKLTDVSFKYCYQQQYGELRELEYNFTKIQKIGNLGIGDFDSEKKDKLFVPENAFRIDWIDKDNRNQYHLILVGKSLSEAEAIREDLVNAFNAWKEKFPKAVLR